MPPLYFATFKDIVIDRSRIFTLGDAASTFDFSSLLIRGLFHLMLIYASRHACQILFPRGHTPILRLAPSRISFSADASPELLNSFFEPS